MSRPSEPSPASDEVFDLWGCDVHRCGERFFVRYEYGGIAPRIVELEITASELQKARNSWQDLHAVIVAHQNTTGPGRAIHDP